MRSPAEDGRLQQIITLLRCHVLGIGCPDFTRFAGAILPANHIGGFVDWTNKLYYNKATNTFARGDWNDGQNFQTVDNQTLFNPNIDNGAGLGEGRHLTFDVGASEVTAGRKPIGMAHDRGINYTDDTIWVGYYEDAGNDNVGRIFIHRFRLTDEDGTTWDSADDTAESLETFILGSRGQFGGASGVLPFNLTPVNGNMRLIGVDKDGYLMVGATTRLGEEFLLLYSVKGASQGDLMDISPSGLDRDDYSAALGVCDFEDGVEDDKRAVRSIFPLFVGQWVSQYDGATKVHLFNQWSPILIDDDRNVFYWYGMPCSRFGGHGPVNRFEETNKESVRDLVTLDQDNIRNRLDVFGLKASAAQSLNGYNLGAEPSRLGWWRAEHQDRASDAFESYEWANNFNAIPFEAPEAPSILGTNAGGGLVVGPRNLVLGKKDLLEGGVTLNDADVIISGGKEVYLIPDTYVPNGYKDGAPV